MANREVFPGSLYPLIGDVESQAGQTTSTVVGFRTIGIDENLPSQDGELLFYRFNDNKYVLIFINDAVSVNDQAMSLNTILNVGGMTLVGSVDVNGTPIG